MSQYIVGYRLLSEVEKYGECNTPYFDFVIFPNIDQAGTVYRQMSHDFCHVAEFRVMHQSSDSWTHDLDHLKIKPTKCVEHNRILNFTSCPDCVAELYNK